LLLKRAMDLLYASVGTAVEATKNTEAIKKGKASWKLPLTAAAAASYYLLTGPSRRAHEAVSSSSSALIQYAWGMVSLPAIKQLSLRASQRLKGAAIAERVTIAGVPCFILSRDPSPGMFVHGTLTCGIILFNLVSACPLFRFSCCNHEGAASEETNDA
jgi:hypothetical protein